MLENTLGQSVCRIFYFGLVNLNSGGPLLHCTCLEFYLAFPLFVSSLFSSIMFFIHREVKNRCALRQRFLATLVGFLILETQKNIFESAMVSCSRFMRIRNSSDHRRVRTANLLHTR